MGSLSREPLRTEILRREEPGNGQDTEWGRKVASPFLPHADPSAKFQVGTGVLEATKSLLCTLHVGGCGREEASISFFGELG